MYMLISVCEREIWTETFPTFEDAHNQMNLKNSLISALMIGRGMKLQARTNFMRAKILSLDRWRRGRI